MILIIRVLNLDRETTAILENAYNLSYEHEINAVWRLPLSVKEGDLSTILKYLKSNNR